MVDSFDDSPNGGWVHEEQVSQLSEAGTQASLHADLSYLMLVQLTPVPSGWARLRDALKIPQEWFVGVHPEVLKRSFEGQLSLT